LISDDDFLKGIEFLVENGIISVSATISESKSLNIGGVDLSQASSIFGSADAEVTIIEFGDYQCPKCREWFLNTKPEIVTNYIETGKANLYFVDLPFLGDDSFPASAATYCANEQGLYWDYHSYLYSNQRGIDGGWANYSSLKDYAEILGLDEESFVDCMDSGIYDESVLLNLEIGITAGVKETPSFVVVGPGGQEFIGGPQPYPVFQSAIDSVLGS
jgi:protein-disulfide isomerase